MQCAQSYLPALSLRRKWESSYRLLDFDRMLEVFNGVLLK